MADTESGLYARAHSKLVEVKPALRGKSFTTKDLWELIGLKNTPEHFPFKKALGDVLYNLSRVNKNPLLVQDGKLYRFIDRDIEEIKWWEPSKKKVLEVRFPRSVIDMSNFGFEDSVKIYSGDLLVLAGEGNRGKTTFALNFLVENMDNYPCTYFTSEFHDLKFQNRIANFDWVDLMNKDRPKFELLPKHEHYEDLIGDRKDNIIIIDWIRMDDDPWKIRTVLDKIMTPLDGGICLVIQQKRTYKNVGEGGEGSVDLASVYLTLSNNRLFVQKVKTPKDYNPNYKNFGFEIDQGAKFKHIREIVKCLQCKGSGVYKLIECEKCTGTGWVDK